MYNTDSSMTRTFILQCCYINHSSNDDLFLSGCTYGSSEECIFPCNCENPGKSCEQTTGDCPKGCKQATGNLTEYGWTGPGCRVGKYCDNLTSVSLSSISRSLTHTHAHYLCTIVPCSYHLFSLIIFIRLGIYQGNLQCSYIIHTHVHPCF